MIEGIRVGLKEEILARAGRLGKSVSQFILISRFHLFHFVGLVLAGLSFSAPAQCMATNVDMVSYAASVVGLDFRDPLIGQPTEGPRRRR